MDFGSIGLDPRRQNPVGYRGSIDAAYTGGLGSQGPPLADFARPEGLRGPQSSMRGLWIAGLVRLFPQEFRFQGGVGRAGCIFSECNPMEI